MDEKNEKSIAELVDQLERAEVIEKVVIYCKPKKEASGKAPKEESN